MSNTINYEDDFIEITGIDSDWTWTDTMATFTDGISVEWIAFSCGSDGDYISIKNRDATGPRIFPNQSGKLQGGGVMAYYYGRIIFPFVDFSASRVTGTHSLVIKLA